MGKLTPEIEAERKKIVKIAEAAGLDFYETRFELVGSDQLNSLAARGGFPVRYPHWRFGMDYEQISKSYEYGLSKIYELVINHDPCYAYLMDANELLDQKLVMAHVYGHCDFFKNNKWFSKTNRKMIDVMANHAVRVRRYVDRYGIDKVEDFIDKCLSVENLIDRYSVFKNEKKRVARANSRVLDVDKFMCDSDIQSIHEQDSDEVIPERDILKFIIHHAELEDWEQDVLNIIRDEAYYFAPQGMTKIMNEGWASFWHSKLMTEQIMHHAEIVDFADRHSGAMVMAPGGFNPYKIGIELMRDIRLRWDKGQFGREWEECDDMAEKANWDKKLGKGMDKIFEVRANYNDVTFIDEFLSEEFCVKNKMFVYKFNKRTGQYELDTRNFAAIKKKFLFQLTNHGQPIISALDHNHNGKGELLLSHLYEGVDMQPDYMRATMENLSVLWKKPVHLATVMDGEARIFRYFAGEFTSTAFSDEVSAKEDAGKSSKATNEDSEDPNRIIKA